jgi:hypothetical protein
MFRKLTSIAILSLLLLSSRQSIALPKYASRTGAKCQSCHVNPTGKGMRSEFGSTYGRDDITFPTFKGASDYEDLSTNLSPTISVGTDYRTLFYAQSSDNSSTFFQMQGDLYFDLRLNKKFRIYIDKGLYSGFEVFGLAKVLPMDGYVKVGKFVPAYGTKVDDHNAFIRGGPYSGAQYGGVFPAGYPTGLRFGERSEDTGIELGFAPSIFTLNIGLFNGLPGVGQPTSTTKDKAIAVRGDARFKLGETNLSLGGSYYNGATSVDKQTYYGAFGAVTVFETVTLTSEVDFVETSKPNVATKTGLMVWNELNWMITQGLDLKLGYQFYDPDKDLATGSFSQITVGAEFFVLSGVELRPLYKINMNDVPGVTGTENNEFLFLFHFFL